MIVDYVGEKVHDQDKQYSPATGRGIKIWPCEIGVSKARDIAERMGKR